MTTIRKLLVRGIRNFGTTEDDEQQIWFRSPLTIICGENGCGKTTIIECLKYAVTGEYPPNTGNGGQFVHDLKLAGSNYCMGKVMLQMVNQKGDSVTINRMMKKEKRGNGPERTTTIDATVTYEKAGNKDRRMFTRRAGDATVEMCNFMNVSKAILNNVIFCHQEDSCWPFSDDKTLKMKFDAIFGTTEYNKVIEKLIKERKSRQEKHKVLVAREQGLCAIKDEVHSKRDRLETYETSFQTKEAKIQDLENQIQPLEEKLKTIAESENQYGMLYKKKVELETSIKSLEARVESSRNKIKTNFTGDIMELRQAIQDFDNRIDETEHSRAKAEREFRQLQQMCTEHEEKIRKTELESQKLQHDIQLQQDTNAHRAQLVQKLGAQIGILPDSLNDLENDNELVDTLMDQLQRGIQLEEDKVAEIVRRHDEMEKKLQREIDELRVDEAKVGTEIGGKQSARASMSKERGELQRQINFIESSQSQMTSLVEEITKKDNELKQLTEAHNLDDARRTLQECKRTRDTLQQEKDLLDENIATLDGVMQTLTEVNLKKEDLAKTESSYKIVLNKNSGNISRLFGKKLDGNFKVEIDRKIRSLDGDIKQTNSRISEHEKRLVELKADRKNQRERLLKMQNEHKEAEREIDDVCGVDDFEEHLEKQKEKFMKAQLDFGAIKSSEALFKKYINEVKEHPCCPLCHKDMDGGEQEMLSTELETEINQLPDKIALHEKILKKEERAYNQVMMLRSSYDQIKRLKAQIPALEEESKKKEVDYKKIQNELDDIQLTLAAPQSNYTTATSMVSDMGQLDNYRGSIDKLNQEIAQLQQKLPANYNADEINNMKTRRTEVQTELVGIRSQIDTGETKLDRLSTKMNKLQEIRTKLIEQKIQLQENFSNLPEKKVRVVQLQQDIERTDTEIAVLQSNLTTVSRNLASRTTEKERAKTENRKIHQTAHNRLTGIQEIHREIKRESEKVREFASRQLEDQLQKMQALYTKKKQELVQHKTKCDSLSVTLDNLKTEIANQDSAKRDLVENLELKQVTAELQEKKKNMQKLETDACNLDYEKMLAEKKKLILKRDTLQANVSEIRGSLLQITSQIKEVQKELQLERNKNAYTEWMKVMHEAAVLNMLISDLEAFRTALDYAVTRFHEEKIAQLNQYIRALWREIYRGNDVDYIEIKSEAPKVKETSTGTARRSYEYRVVQCKNNKEMDMRGRCSAGQKVLASLIIRMALSETFAANCSVMTLDEPTTNLDQQNIASLCEAIGRILNDRRRYGNLLLIIITHDEKFLQTLAPHLEAAYRVSRNRQGKSVITKV